MRPFAEISSLVDSFDLEAYLEDRGFRRLTARSGEWVGDCPHCRKEKKIAVNVSRRRWHCWVCQKIEESFDQQQQRWRRRCTFGGGGVVKLIRWLENCEFTEAISILTHHQVWMKGSIQTVESEIMLEAVLDTEDHLPIPPPEGWSPILYQMPYLARRGVTLEDVQAYGLVWCPTGRYRDRLIFPVWEGSRLVYWQARAMFEAEDCPPGHDFRKALNPPRMRDSAGNPIQGYAVSTECLMNLDRACSYARVAVVEGPMDLIRTGPDSVCTFGKAISPAQIARMVRRGVQAVDLIWDGPTPKEPQGAHREMLHVAPWLSLFFDLRLVFLPYGDPADHSREKLAMYRAVGVAPSTLSRTAYL